MINIQITYGKEFRNFDFDFEGYLLQQNGEGRGGTPYKHRQGRLQFL